MKKQTIYTILRHVSNSGMSRHIDAYTFINNKPVYMTNKIADALDYKRAKNGSLKVSGCGMDMGFHIVYEYGEATKRDGYYYRQEWL